MPVPARDGLAPQRQHPARILMPVRSLASRWTAGVISSLAVFSAPQAATDPAGDDAPLEEIVVVGITPNEGARRPRSIIPRYVQTVSALRIEQSLSLDLADFMQRNLASVSINSAQNNPLQPDLQFRGYTASPLLGLAQGLAVYQDGARLNEPLGDAVNWDLVPGSAVHRLSLTAGGDPLFGLNSLGGAVTLQMKTGFNFEAHEAEGLTGSHGRTVWTLQSGGNNGTLGYYVNVEQFREDGWRDLSPSGAEHRYASLSWRRESSAADLGLHSADSDLTGNGASPVGLLARDRDAVFTAPDETDNELTLVTLEARHELSEAIQLTGSAFTRRTRTHSFNGDASEYTVCRLGDVPRLLESAEEDDLEEAGLELEALCDGSFGDADALQRFISGRTDGSDVELRDLTDELSGSGRLSGEAINNRSSRDQASRGVDLSLEVEGSLFGVDHQLVAGARHYRGDVEFDARVELAQLHPQTRSTTGLGLGTFVDAEATSISSETTSWSFYLSDSIALSDSLSLTLSGRYDATGVRIDDRSGVHPEVEGDHDFQRFNPAAGLTWQWREHVNVYASVSQSSRAPTPIELTCNEEVFRRAADADNAEFECRLPNAFVADPPLDQVVVTSAELGARGTAGPMHWHAGLFHQVNRDDIVFQTTGRATGLFGAVDETRRQGLELSLSGGWRDLSYHLGYTYLDATFQDTFQTQSPAHPMADESGEIPVPVGSRIPGIPDHQLKTGVDWRVGENLSVGADLVAFSGAHLRGDEGNYLDRTDAYTVVDLRGRYVANEHLALFARVSNLFDTGYENFGLVAEDPGEVIEDLPDRRPYFLAPGPPRAAWVGLRLKL